MQKIYRILSICMLLSVCGGIPISKLNAQQPTYGNLPYTCGSDWARRIDNQKVNEATRLNNPQVYNKMVARAAAEKSNIPTIARSGSSVDEIPLEFFLVNQSTGERLIINAVSKYISDNVIVWVDVRDTGTGGVRQETIDKLVEGVEHSVKAGPNTRDANKGVIENDIDIFGAPPEDEWGVKIHLLIVDIIDSNLTGGTINGYFYPLDQTKQLGSNEKNLLYIDSPPLRGNSVSQNRVNTVLGTVAHEFQHLINYRRYQGAAADNETHWIYNEGLSEIASIRNGYEDRSTNAFLGAPNAFAFFDAPIGSSNGDTILPAYARGMLFMYYLWEQFGDTVLNALVAAPGPNLNPVQVSLGQIGQGNIQADEVFTNFWRANYLQNSENSMGDPRYRYRTALSGGSASSTRKLLPQETKSEEQDVKGYAAYLFRYTNATADINKVSLRIRFFSNSHPYQATAIIFRENDVIEVKPLTADEDYRIERYTTVTFLINSLGPSEQTVKWEVDTATLGVEDYATDRSFLAFTGTVPNPARGEVRLNFHTSTVGGVRLQLFDLKGEEVERLIDGDRYESGDHTVWIDLSGIPAGVYTARLEDESGALSVRQIVVVK